MRSPTLKARLSAAAGAAVIGALALSGCSADPGANDASFDRVVELKDAFVEAGGLCGMFEVNPYAATEVFQPLISFDTMTIESAKCAQGDSVTFMVFDEAADRREFTAAMLQSVEDGTAGLEEGQPFSIITGENWHVWLLTDEADKAQEFADALGGRVAI